MKKLLCGLMLAAAIFAVVPAYALDLDEHVSLAPNGRGDLMFFPVYVALDGGWETKLVVVNTSTVYSTVAKVVLRSYVYSKELLDFFIYLSPTDVWTGKIISGPTGPRLFSDDDSILVSQNVFASPANPVNQDIVTSVCSDDSKNLGYVEVFEAWSSSIGAKPRPKYDPINPLASVKGAFDAATVFVTRNILAGHYEIINDVIGVAGSETATVLKDYDVFARLGIQSGEETFIGQNANNNGCEVEAALSKSDVGLYFYDTTANAKFALPILTFPTKLVNNTACVCGDNSNTTNAALRNEPDFPSPFFTQQTTGDDYVNGTCYKIQPDFLVSDLLETTSQNPLFSPAPSGAKEPIEEEVHFIIKDYAFTEGWIEIPFNYTTTCEPLIDDGQELRYTGAPVLLTDIFLGANGTLEIMNGNWDFGAVSYDDGGGFFPLTYNYQLDDNTTGN